ncbi:MAG: hypothetical protein IJA85_02325 [Clostridia bacterium]|nr:hypothetical protein [Clostridia bacterium]
MKRIRKLICIVLSIAMLLILPVSADSNGSSGSYELTCEDRSVTIYYSSSAGGTEGYGHTGSTMDGYLSTSSEAYFTTYNYTETKYGSDSSSVYGSVCIARPQYSDDSGNTYYARSVYSSHSYYATDMGAWNGSSDDSVTVGVNSYGDIYFTGTTSYVYNQ